LTNLYSRRLSKEAVDTEFERWFENGRKNVYRRMGTKVVLQVVAILNNVLWGNCDWTVTHSI
jgi:hypothetical protein